MRSPPGPVLADPLVLQRGVLVQLAELGEVDVHQGLDRLPGPPGQQIRGQQAAHRLGQRIVVPLRAGAQVPAARGGGQGVQDGLHHRGAFGGQVAVDDAGAVQGGVQGQPAVQVLVVVGVGVGPGGAGADLRADRGQCPQVRPGPGGGDQDLLGLVPVLAGDGPGPPGQLQGDRRGDHVAVEQPGQQHLVVAGQRLDRQVLPGLAPGDPGHVDQPGPGAPLAVSQVRVLSVEGHQQAAADRRLDRVGPLQDPQPVRDRLGGHGRRVLRGQELQRGRQHAQRLGSGGRDRPHAHIQAHLPQAGWMLFLIRLYPGGLTFLGWPGEVFDYFLQ